MISLKIETMAGNLPAIYFLEIVQSGGSVEQKGVLGDPVFEKLDANLSKALMSIGAVKAVEIGDGTAVAVRHYRERRHRLHHDYGPGNDHRIVPALDGKLDVFALPVDPTSRCR